MLKGKKGSKKIEKVTSGRGIIHGKFSFNNTILRLTKEDGKALGKTISAGSIELSNGKKVTGSRKGTVSMAEKVAEETIKLAADFGIHNIVEIRVRGIGAGRNSAIEKIIEEKSLNIGALVDRTPIPHGGCRPRKRPRK